MKRRSEREGSKVLLEGAPDMAVLISAIQQQLVSVERKIDTLINRPGPSAALNRPQSFDNRRSERKFYQVICADCRKQCEVPFRPSPDRPVYCKECFAKRKSSSGSSQFQHKQENRIVERDFRAEKHPEKQKKEKAPRKRKKRA